MEPMIARRASPAQRRLATSSRLRLAAGTDQNLA